MGDTFYRTMDGSYTQEKNDKDKDGSKWIWGLACEDGNVELMCIYNRFQVI